MTPRRGWLALLVAGMLAAPAWAQGEARVRLHREGMDGIARVLALAACEQGSPAALRLAGPSCPSTLRVALRELAVNPGAADVRAMRGSSAQLDLLEDLLADLPGVAGALEGFAADAAKRLARELDWAQRRGRTLRAAAQALRQAAEKEGIPSRVAVRARPEGETLLLFAARGPFLTRRLARAQDGDAHYAALLRLFDREPDELGRALLRLELRVAAEGGKLADRAGVAAELQRAARDGAGSLESALQDIQAAIEAAQVASRLIRDLELKSVVRGDRGAALDEVVPLLRAYRSQFNEPPALGATSLAGVYADQRTARLHFWLAGTGAWVRGPARVDPIAPVSEALLGAEDLDLQRLGTRAWALARLYLLFEEPFAEGLERYERAAARAAARLKRLERQAGLDPAAFGAGLARQAGVPAELLQGPPEAAAARLREHLLRVALQQGAERARGLVAAMGGAVKALEGLRLQALEVALAGVPRGTPLELSWTPRPEGPRWWLPPPGAAQAGTTLRVVLLEGEAAETPSLSAFAWLEGAVHAGRVDLAPGAPATLSLAPGPPGLDLVWRPAGLFARQLPSASPRLELWRLGPGPEDARLLRPVPGGAWSAADPADPPGRYRLEARDATGKVQPLFGEPGLSIPATRGVMLARPRVAPGESLAATVLEGGKGLPGPHPFRVHGPGGEVLAAGDGERLALKVKLPPGRYTVSAGPGTRPAPLAVAPADPRVLCLRDPRAAKPAPGVAPGETCFLRVDAWPTVLAEEVLEVRWTVAGGKRPHQARTTPLPGVPGRALRLPLRISARSKPGDRQVRAELVTARGVVPALGSFRIRKRGSRLALRLERDGKALEGGARVSLGGDPLLLRASEAHDEARWLLLGPSGLLRTLEPRFDGAVPLQLEADEPAGPYQVWFWGMSAEESPTPRFGSLALEGDPIRPLALRAPAQPQVGEPYVLDLRPPQGFRGPFQHRLGQGPWRAGARYEGVVAPRNELELGLRDAEGREARGALSFSGKRRVPVAGSSGPRYGYVANVSERRVFAVDHALLQTYRVEGGLPGDWVVLEPGPMSAAAVRDRMFERVPFDGAAEGAQVAYRSQRFWDQLQVSARARFAELEVEAGTPFDVLDSPAPGGEATLRDLVARLLDRQGGWTFRLASVQVSATGAAPDGKAPRKPDAPVRLVKSSLSESGGAAPRITVTGPLAELELVSRVPETISLEGAARLSFSLFARRGELVEGRPYPRGWEQLAARAFCCPELELELELGQRRETRLVRGLGKDAAGVALGLVFAHLRSERDGDGPRQAEQQSIRLEGLSGPGEPLAWEQRFAALSPGALAGESERLTIVLRGTQQRALSPAAWPAEREKPAAIEIDEARFFFEARDVPLARIEVRIEYLRQPGAGDETPAPLGALHAGGEPAELPPPEQVLARVDELLEAGQAEAALRAAQQALAGGPRDPRAWTALARAQLKVEHYGGAQGHARWALALEPTAARWLLLAEAHYAAFEFEEALEAVRAGAGLSPAGAVAERLGELQERLEEELGE